jgi:hypothetical protein
VLGELDREAAKRRTVDAGEKPLHHPLRHDLDPAQSGDFGGIEKVGALGVRQGHGWQKLMNGGLSRVEDSRALVI